MKMLMMQYLMKPGVSETIYSPPQNFIYYPTPFLPVRGERISIRNFEGVRSQLVSEKDPVVKQKLSFLLGCRRGLSVF
ncbi:MAG: hypothetical protein SYNGOMJ08_00700 [Candidatus Syntrophoarchaeum sp. GoM_oil]|nr:MAG: hypothetical protein SYNGOMJ08_00700 [Candidatus Syntrophoarchaeum sp. GoM_oil]